MTLTDSVGRVQLVIGGLALLLALGAIGGAWSFQLMGGYVPCALCLEQREPYYFGIPILILALLFTLLKPQNWLARIFYLIFAIVIGYGFYLAIYHAGAEWELWLGPSDCGGQAMHSNDTSSLLAQARFESFSGDLHLICNRLCCARLCKRERRPFHIGDGYAC